MKKIIVLGSLNMDLTIQSDFIPKKGETINGHDFFTNPGGKGGNQVVAAAKMGADTTMIANVGHDLFGQEILKKLKDYGVDTSHVLTDENEATGVAIVIRCEHDNRIILGNGANHSLEFAAVKEELDKVARKGDIFLTQLENRFDVVMESLRYAKELGLLTILNPAPARVISEEMYSYIDLIVVNQTECQLLTGIFPNDEDSCMMGLDEFKKKGCKAIITLGSHGSVAAYNDELLFVPSQKVETVDTTAAGDSYIGALCHYLALDRKIEDALNFASKVAAMTVTKKGAQISIPTINEVCEYYKEEF